MRGFLWMNFTR
uniref:Uncharacterized protein MANES_06G044400 n=1 Tax=Rhizophora mucronata TaxID=61149 RepID=A0A2P2J1E6_RHIMU